MLATAGIQRTKPRKRKLPEYRHLGCPMTRGFLLWCYGTCKPQKGVGACGRIFPWQFKGVTQKAIARDKASRVPMIDS